MIMFHGLLTLPAPILMALSFAVIANADPPNQQENTWTPPPSKQTLPNRPKTSVMWAEQGWDQKARDFYHLTSQGTVIAPLSWFKALELPQSKTKLSNQNYLTQLGFLFEPKGSSNPYNLPIGFSLLDNQQGFGPVVGLTCAACHSGQLNYRGRSLRIDGGQSGAAFTMFINSYRDSVIKTYNTPAKYERFARQVLGKNYKTMTAYTALHDAFGYLTQDLEWGIFYEKEKNLYPTQEGFTRLDAIGRIGNSLFGSDLHEASNFRVANAPVNFPPLWDIWKFDWVQYNGSVHQPMARNVGEALGVGALTNFIDSNGSPNPSPEKWNSSIPVANVYQIEQLVQTLHAPRWPNQLFGRYDTALALVGRIHYEQKCSACHAPRPIEKSQNEKVKWAVTMVALDKIGTDPTEAVNFAKNRQDASKITGFPSIVSPAEGLRLVTEEVKNRAYDLIRLTPEERQTYDGFSRANLVRAPCAYKARPLDGVWSTPPFLHNGSVPNIYELLSPVSERTHKFWLGSYDYDPVKLGYVLKKKLKGGSLLDTRITGNANTGHEFSNTPGPGVIGPALSHNDRMALIEYIKAMPDMPPTPLSPVPADWGDHAILST